MVSSVSPCNRWSHFTLVCEWNEPDDNISILACSVPAKLLIFPERHRNDLLSKFFYYYFFQQISAGQFSPTLHPFSVLYREALEPRVQSGHPDEMSTACEELHYRTWLPRAPECKTSEREENDFMTWRWPLVLLWRAHWGLLQDLHPASPLVIEQKTDLCMYSGMYSTTNPLQRKWNTKGSHQWDFTARRNSCSALSVQFLFCRGSRFVESNKTEQSFSASSRVYALQPWYDSLAYVVVLFIHCIFSMSATQ